MYQYELSISPEFLRRFKRISKNDKRLSTKTKATLKNLRKRPFRKDLRTHKVATRKYGTAYSSRITGDLRILWDFRGKKTTIMVLTIGGHSGRSKVY